MASLSSTSLTSTVQPPPIPNGRDLSMVEAAPVLNQSTPAEKPRVFRRVRPGLRRVAKITADIFAVLFIGLIYGLPGALFVGIVAVLMIGLSFGVIAADGAIALLIGNAILRAAHLAHYTDNASAAAIGATGAVVAVLIVGLLVQWIPTDANDQLPWPVSMCCCVLVMTLAGTLGCAILRHNHVDLGGIDVLHATRAGALGGGILGPGMIIAGPIMAAALTIILSPLWLAMSMGLRWVYVRSSESWSERGVHRSSYCYTYGTCGDDSDIEEELEQIPRSIRR